jgi:hypothetical protein
MYRTSIEARGPEGNVLTFNGYVPEDFNITIDSEWEPFGGLSEALGGRAIEAAQNINKATVGGKLVNKYLTPQVWGGPSYLQIDLPFELNSWENTQKDVMDPIVALLRLVTPTTSSAGMLATPGPSPVEQAVNQLNNGQQIDQSPENLLTGRIITLQVGEFFRMTPCLITSVQSTFAAQFDHNSKLPIASTVNVALQSYYPVTSEDIQVWFNYNNGGARQNAGN